MPCEVGFDHKLYYNSATHASPTWVEVAQVGDLSADVLRRLAEVLIRESRWPGNCVGSFDATITFPMLYNPGGTAFDALRTMFFANGSSAHKQFYIADGASGTSGTQGLRIACVMENFPWKSNLNAPSMIDQVTLRPAYFEESGSRVEPDWYTVP